MNTKWWWSGVVVACLSRSTKLPYIGPGEYYNGWPFVGSSRICFVSVCNQPPRPTQPGHPSVSRQNEYWQWQNYRWRRKRRVPCNSRHVTMTADLLTYGVAVYASLNGFNLCQLKDHNSDELPCNRPCCPRRILLFLLLLFNTSSKVTITCCDQSYCSLLISNCSHSS